MEGDGQKLMTNAVPEHISSKNSTFKSSKAKHSGHDMLCNKVKPTDDKLQTFSNEVFSEEQSFTLNDVQSRSEIQRRSGRKIKLTEKVKQASILPQLKKQNCKKSISTALLCCSIKSCKKPKSDEYNLHKFPNDINVRQNWITNCHNHIENIAEVKLSFARVCGRHFEDNLFQNPNKKSRLLSSAVPTLFHNSDETKSIKPSSEDEHIVYTENSPLNTPKTTLNVNSVSVLKDVHSTETNLSTEYINSPNTKVIDVTVPLTLSISNLENNYVAATSITNVDKTTKKTIPPAEILIEPPSKARKLSSYGITEFIDLTASSEPLLKKVQIKTAINLSDINSSQTSSQKNNSIEITELTNSNIKQTLESVDNRLTGCQLDNPIEQINLGVNIKYIKDVSIVGIHTVLYKNVEDIHKNYFSVALPTEFWKITYCMDQNATYFCVGNEKKVIFNSLVPNITIYGKQYNYHEEVKSRLDLENLLKQIDTLNECFGNNQQFNPCCAGYYDSDVDYMCCKCLKWIEDHKLFRNKTATSTMTNHPNHSAVTTEIMTNAQNPSNVWDLKHIMCTFDMNEVRTVFNTIFCNNCEGS